MRAQNLNICIPYTKCNKDCPFCISKMTGYIVPNSGVSYRNLNKIKNICQQSGVTHVLITGKGEPLVDDQSIEITLLMMQHFENYILELQTNGLSLIYNPSILDKLSVYKLNTLAISIDNIADLKKLEPVFKNIDAQSIISRLVVNITSNVMGYSFEDWIDTCKKHKIKQLTFRQVTVPNQIVDTLEAWKTKNWIMNNINAVWYNNLIEQFIELTRQNPNARNIRRLVNGARVWDVDGIAFTHFNACIQESNSENDIRSLVLMEDGHLYDSWRGGTSILL